MVQAILIPTHMLMSVRVYILECNFRGDDSPQRGKIVCVDDECFNLAIYVDKNSTYGGCQSLTLPSCYSFVLKTRIYYK